MATFCKADDRKASDSKANDNDLQTLREIQQQVQAVVSKNMPSCVAVSDGIGFGSGVIISAEGLILTAGHVITGPGPFEVILPSGRTVKAKALGKNLDVDTGMVQITEQGPWPFVDIADVQSAGPNDPMVGRWVVSMGHSGGFELGRVPPVRTGRVLSRRKHQIITDAVLIGGDSGGPLFDLTGRLIAIHSSIGDSIAENRHVTIDLFHRDWDRLKRGDTWGELPELNEPGEKRRPGKIGVVVDRTSARAVVKSVTEHSPADESGIQVGDIIIEFNRTQIRNGDHLIELIKSYNAGQVFPLVIERGGKRMNLEIQIR
jgi:serine protease Do